jgi:hypothetical protein
MVEQLRSFYNQLESQEQESYFNSNILDNINKRKITDLASEQAAT